MSEIPREHVHAWLSNLDSIREPPNQLQKLLSSTELRRADQFRFPFLRSRFIVARAILRTLLGRYLQRAPEFIRFEYGPHGKPALYRHPELHFNISHSGDRAIFAFHPIEPLGVDIECIRPMPDALDLATRFFSASESARLRALPVGSRPEAFFRCWTRKEALVKATGLGLASPLSDFSVSFDERACLLETDGSSRDIRVKSGPQPWKLFHLQPEKSICAAIAIRYPVNKVLLRPYRED